MAKRFLCHPRVRYWTAPWTSLCKDASGWILLYGNYPDAKKGAAAKDFVKWGITDGQQYAESLGYCTLPDFIRERPAKAIEEIK